MRVLPRLLRFRRERRTPPRRPRCAVVLPSDQQCPHLARRGKTTCRYHPEPGGGR